MDEANIISTWQEHGRLAIGSDALLNALAVLIKHKHKDFFLTFLGGNGWGISKMY